MLNKVGERIKSSRKKRGLTLKEVADKYNVYVHYSNADRL